MDISFGNGNCLLFYYFVNGDLINFGYFVKFIDIDYIMISKDYCICFELMFICVFVSGNGSGEINIGIFLIGGGDSKGGSIEDELEYLGFSSWRVINYENVDVILNVIIVIEIFFFIIEK